MKKKAQEQAVSSSWMIIFAVVVAGILIVMVLGPIITKTMQTIFGRSKTKGANDDFKYLIKTIYELEDSKSEKIAYYLNPDMTLMLCKDKTLCLCRENCEDILNEEHFEEYTIIIDGSYKSDADKRPEIRGDNSIIPSNNRNIENVLVKREGKQITIIDYCERKNLC